jgi:predicted DNA-binding transcriptional regulator AlpA
MSKLVDSNGQYRHHVSTRPGLWTAAQVRNYLSVSTTWVYRRLKSDAAFPRPIKFGARNFWRVEAIEGWVRKQEVAS